MESGRHMVKLFTRRPNFTLYLYSKVPGREGEKEGRELATSEMIANFPRRRILGHDDHLPAVLVTVLWRSGVLRREVGT